MTWAWISHGKIGHRKFQRMDHCLTTCKSSGEMGRFPNSKGTRHHRPSDPPLSPATKIFCPVAWAASCTSSKFGVEGRFSGIEQHGNQCRGRNEFPQQTEPLGI